MLSVVGAPLISIRQIARIRTTDLGYLVFPLPFGRWDVLIGSPHSLGPEMGPSPKSHIKNAK